MVHETYRRLLTLRYMNSPPQSLHEAISVARKFPRPEELSTDFIVEFLNSYDNINTRAYYYYIIKVICNEIGRPELIEPIPRPKEVSTIRRRDLLTPNEIAALQTACKDLYERAMIELLVESGCRIGEVLSLNVEDITTDDNFLYVDVIGKTGTRQIPLLKDNLPSFQYHLVIRLGGPVFNSSRYPDRTISYRVVLDKIVDIFQRAGVRKRARTIHIFRHTKATHLIEMGVPESIIKKFMGWSETSDTITKYTHLTNKSVKDFFSRLYGIDEEPIEPLFPDEERDRIKKMFG